LQIAEAIFLSINFTERAIADSIRIRNAGYFVFTVYPRRSNLKSPAVLLAVLVCFGTSTIARAQTSNSIQNNQTPSYRVNVVSRTTPAVKYKHRSGSTMIDFRGTDLMPGASGEAKVKSHSGAIEVKAEFSNLQQPNSFGPEYLTYVIWAISPEGRSVNLGEVLVDGDHRGKLEVTTDLQAFALIVTAEPYYAVRRPSNVVILENSIRPDTAGTVEAVDAKYELIDRGGYIPTGYHYDAVVLDSRLPLEFFEARNAIHIARSEGAENYAATSFEKADGLMKQADDLALTRNHDRKELIALSREVVQTADDSREIAVKRMDADRINADRERNAAATNDANRRAADSDRATADAQRQQRNAEADSDRNRAAANNANQAASDAQQNQRNAEADSDRNRALTADANRATADAQQGQRNAEAESERDRNAAANSEQRLQQAVQDREELRAKLLAQFNAIFATRDTARGLIVSMPDVLFDTGKSTLRQEAREKLAQISGIVLAYPDLHLAIEGYTDSVGGDVMNQTLSEARANAVRDYLLKENVPTASMTSQGFGKTQPIASNDTAEGRQQNRRVELVVSGEDIGTVVGVVSEYLPLTPRQ
jgi:outer membrane protein OmpA-like peptidoglycan-associated protein